MERIPEFAAGGWTPFNSPLLAFVLTSLIIEMTPGPNMAYLACSAPAGAASPGSPPCLASRSDWRCSASRSDLGGGSLVLNNGLAYESLRWAGALYLCWLAFDSWREARQPIEIAAVNRSLAVHFRRGFITNLLNPKAALFFITVVPEFASRPAPSPRELAILISIYVGVATLVHSLIVVLAGGLQAFLAAPQRRKMAGNVFAVLLLAIAAWLFVSGGR